MLKQTRQAGLWAILACLFLAVGGCASRTTAKPVQATPQGMVTVKDAAIKLRMAVTASSANAARMSDGRNELVVLAPPHSGAWLNGRRLNHSRVVATNRTIYLALAAVDEAWRYLHGQRPSPIPEIPALGVPSGPGSATASGVVVLDAGHGGSDPGAPNAFGPSEKHITLDTALRVRDALQKRGVRVIMTRIGDTYPTLAQRIALSNREKPRLFVSIHADAAANKRAKGFTVYASRQASAKSVAAAKQMVTALKRTGAASREVRRANYKVITDTNAPAILIEMGFLSNPGEARLLATPAYRQRMADAIADGVIRTLNQTR